MTVRGTRIPVVWTITTVCAFAFSACGTGSGGSDARADLAADVQQEQAGWDPGEVAPPADTSGEANPDAADPGGDVPAHPDVSPPCCTTDEECGTSRVCIGKDLPGGGVCLDRPPSSKCFGKDDCLATHFCWGADLCSCTMDCTIMPGDCLPLPGDCCETDADCQPGYGCALILGSDTGVCELAAPPGKCWDDMDCKPWQICEGEKVCPCTADCADPDRMGTCFDNLPGCCESDLDCKEGDRVCVPVPGGAIGVCKSPVDPSTDDCWSAADCAPTEACVGVSICPCDADCLKEAPGTCVEAGCCKLDTDCGDGLLCAQPQMGGTCQPKPPAGKCWKDSDCYSTQKCKGSAFCPYVLAVAVGMLQHG